jgi:hypothetical protein
MRQSQAMRAMTRDIAAGVEACRNECEYFSVCGGGAPVNKLSENGSFATSKTSFCSLVYMTPTDLILNALDHLELDVHHTAGPLSLCGTTAPCPTDPLQGAPRVPHGEVKKRVSNLPDVAVHQIERGS